MRAAFQRLNGFFLISYHEIAGAEEISGQRPLGIMLGYVFEFLPFRASHRHPCSILPAYRIKPFFGNFELEYQQVQSHVLALTVRRASHAFIGHVRCARRGLDYKGISDPVSSHSDGWGINVMTIVAGGASVKRQQIFRRGIGRQLYPKLSRGFVAIEITIESLQRLLSAARCHREEA